MTPVSIHSLGVVPKLEREVSPERMELREAAAQFEAILLRQMLSSARNTSFGDNELFGGQGQDTFVEMRDSQFAELAAKSGQIGFADTIESQLARFLPQGDD
jgi:flagellar protein FlgJ